LRVGHAHEACPIHAAPIVSRGGSLDLNHLRCNDLFLSEVRGVEGAHLADADHSDADRVASSGRHARQTAAQQVRVNGEDAGSDNNRPIIADGHARRRSCTHASRRSCTHASSSAVDELPSKPTAC
jgi:hypothetical protein